jgi:heme-degrading monooxygenase HmoA
LGQLDDLRWTPFHENKNTNSNFLEREAMFAQATHIRVPEGAMPQLRELISAEYLPVVQTREGFVAARFLEQIDDPEAALLIVYWESQQSVEAFHRTGVLQASVQTLAAILPGLRVEREGYVVTMSIENEKAAPAAMKQ